MIPHIFTRRCLTATLLFLIILVFAQTYSYSQEKKQILILHSYNKGLDWTDNEDRGIMTILSSYLDTIEIHTEFMDTKRVPIHTFSPDFLRYLQKKYASGKFDCIITTDDDAFNFMYRNRQDLFPGVPIVFCGVNYFNDSKVEASHDTITGVVEAFDIPATLEIALRLEPETSKVVVINDRTTTGIANRKILDGIIPEFESRVQFEFLENLSMSELLGKVRALKQGTIILLMTFNRDSTGHDFDYNQSIALISQAAQVPIYGVWQFYLGKGIVGGMLTSGRIQGEIAGKMALRILNGEKVENIAIIKESPNRFMFDYRQLKRFDIPFSRLPKSALVANKPQTFHQLHPQLFYSGIATLISLLLIILLLLGRMRERRQSLEELEKAHRQTVTILESIADGFVAFDKHFRFTYINNEAEKILGKNRAELIDQLHWDVFPFTVGGPIEKFYHQVMETREAGELENFHGFADLLENQWIALKAYPAEGGGISVYFRDITEKKKADEELIRLATAIEQSAEAIFISDIRWIIRYVNPAFENMSGYAKNEIIGQHTRILRSDAHDEAFYRRIRATLEAGKVWSGRITSRKKDGSVFESEATDTPVRDASGNIINYVGVSRDITIEMRLEKELRQAQKMEAIGTLAGGVAHDFNNILSIIMGFTEMAKMKLPESSPAAENLQRVLDAGSRATELVKQILTFSRWKEQEKKPVQIASFIKETLKLMRPLLPTTIEIRQEFSVPPEQTIVLIDPTEIHQVLMNLCTNAAHAMRDTGGTLSVRVSELVADTLLVSRHLDLELGSYICLSVSDTGIGMDEATVERIFDPYFTTKELGVGTGLGLPVVQGIVKGHHGAITVYSEPGKGTTFNVYLPKIEGGRLHAAISREIFPPGSERILFLDDEKNMAELGEEMLAPFGYKVTAMTSSPEALETIKKNPEAFDLVITDMTMPAITGKQLALEIKAIRPDLPIILCTGFSELINETKAKESGIDAFLMKPYAAGDLVRTIHRVLEK